jgi:hypothetical protein
MWFAVNIVAIYEGPNVLARYMMYTVGHADWPARFKEKHAVMGLEICRLSGPQALDKHEEQHTGLSCEIVSTYEEETKASLLVV